MSLKCEYSIQTMMGRLDSVNTMISAELRVEQVALLRQHVDGHQRAHGGHHLGREHPHQDVLVVLALEEGHGVGRRRGQHQPEQGGDHAGDHRVLGVQQVVAALLHLVKVLQRGHEEQLGRHRNGLQLGLERGQQQPAQREEQQQGHAPGGDGAQGQ